MNKAFDLLAVLVLLLVPPVARADMDAIDLPLESLVDVRVISMPKFAENVDSIPSVVTLLSREDIRAFGWRTLGDALRTVQGFNVTSDHTYQFAGVRGISQPGDYRPRLQILIDGVAANENIFASAAVDSSFPLDLDLVERIEIVRGPSASVFGGDAMFGVINVVTRSGQSVDGRELAVGIGVGSEHSRRGRLSWGGRLGETDLLLSATRFLSEGSRLAFDGLGAADQVGGEGVGQFFLRARGSDWRVTLIANERERRVPTGSYDSIFNDPGHVETDRYLLVDLARDWRLTGSTTLRQRLYHGEYQYDGDFPKEHLPADPRVINRDTVRGAWWGFDNHLSLATGAHQLTFGIEYRADTRQHQVNEDLGVGCYGAGPAPCLDARTDGRQITAFVQDEILLTAATRLSLGLRHDRHSSFGTSWSPRFGVVHDAGQYGLLKLLYGSAYRTPSAYERFYPGYANPALHNERLKSLELAWEKSLSSQTRLTTAMYGFRIEDMITPDSLGTAENAAAVRGHGIEIDLEQRWAPDWRLRMNYSLQKPSGPVSLLDNSPRQMLKANLVMPGGLPGLQAGLEVQYVDRRLVASGTATVPSYTLANFNLLFAPRDTRWALSLNVRNLFDKRYYDPVSSDPAAWPIAYPQTGRSTMLRAETRF